MSCIFFPKHMPSALHRRYTFLEEMLQSHGVSGVVSLIGIGWYVKGVVQQFSFINRERKRFVFNVARSASCPVRVLVSPGGRSRRRSVRAIGVFGPLQLHLEPLHAYLEAVHGLDGGLCAGRVVEAHEACGRRSLLHTVLPDRRGPGSGRARGAGQSIYFG